MLDAIDYTSPRYVECGLSRIQAHPMPLCYEHIPGTLPYPVLLSFPDCAGIPLFRLGRRTGSRAGFQSFIRYSVNLSLQVFNQIFVITNPVIPWLIFRQLFFE